MSTEPDSLHRDSPALDPDGKWLERFENPVDAQWIRLNPQFPAPKVESLALDPEFKSVELQSFSLNLENDSVSIESFFLELECILLNRYLPHVGR